jgi:hypothetical protein
VIGALLLVVVSQRSRWLGFVSVWIALSLLPWILVPLYEGLHEHHLALGLVGLSLGVGSIAPSNIRSEWHGEQWGIW